MSLFTDFQPQCYYLIYEASYLENWIGHGYFKSRLWSQKGKVSFSKGMCVYVSVLSTCVRSALTLRSSTWPSRLFHQWESTPLNGLPGSALTPNKSETPLITQSRHYRTTLTSTTTQTTPKTWLHTIMYKWFVYMLAKTEKKAGKFKNDKSVWFFIFQIILWI